jgi:acyl-CoA synthetase (AMP-forming)/AMP-acid ligase II
MTTYCNYAFETQYQYSNLIDLLQYRAKNQSEQVAYRFIRQGTSEIDRITYQELDRQAKAIAALLQTTSTLGERALLLYPQSKHVAVTSINN